MVCIIQNCNMFLLTRNSFQIGTQIEKYHEEKHSWDMNTITRNTEPDFTASVDTKDVNYPVNIGQVSVLKHILKVTRVPASKRNHTIKPTITLMLIFYLLHTIVHNSDMLRSILIIFRELLNINRAYIKTPKDY